MDNAGFLAIDKFWYVIFLGAFVGVSFYSFHKRKEILSLFAINDDRNFWRSSLLLFLLFSLGFLALLKPYFGYTELSVTQPSRDIMVVFDISPSMLADDVSPNRLEFAKRKLRDLVEALKNQGQGARIGIVLFSGMSYLYCPLTNDYSVISAYARSIGPDLITTPGSVLLQALETAKDALESAHALSANSSALLLLSDGEERGLSDSEVGNISRSIGVPIYAIGFGTEAGKPVPDRQGQFLKDDTGAIVHSRLQSKILESLADESGGKYQAATLGDNDLHAILSGHSMLPAQGTGTKTTVRNYNEIGPYLVWIMVLLIIFAQLTGKKELFLILLLTMAFAEGSVKADERLEYRAYRDFENGDYESAYKRFSEALAAGERTPELLDATGSAAYRLGKFDEAQKLYEEGLKLKKSFKTEYNLGNSYLQQKKYKEAIQAYNEALTMNEKSLEADHNLNLAKKLLEEQKKDNEQQQEQNDEKNEDQSEQQDQQDKNQENKDQGEDSKEHSGNSDSQDSEEQNQQEKDSNNNPSDKDRKENEPSDDGKQEQEDPSDKNEEAGTPQNSQSQENSEEHEGNIEKQEAKAWLDSLEDAPLLLRRHSGQATNRSGQQW